MKRILALLSLALLLAIGTAAQDYTSQFSEAAMRERVKTLSSDAFAGRGPGTPGGQKAAEYIAAQMRAAGVQPGNGRSYFQPIDFIAMKADPNTTLHVSGKNGTEDYRFLDDFVAATGAQKASVKTRAELVFVGYGIDSPLFNWNDYKGNAADFRGKYLMILVNDPPATEKEPRLFGGDALTYFGRWTYKYEEAARRGAAGVILVHTDTSAGYGWNVIRSSNGSWRYEILRSRSDKTPFLNVRAWATENAAQKILAQAGLDLNELAKAARTRDFKPVKTGLTVSLDLESETKQISSPNVVGKVAGSDPKLRSEYVVYSAHYDHLGIGEPNKDGDKIYNGAYDNASGVSAVLGIADVVAKMPVSRRPKRSIFFLFPAAEEQGLLGAEYYARHPLVPLARTAANINLDGVNFVGKVSDFIALGANRSSMIGYIESAAKERKYTIKDDPDPGQGFFFRSDHFPFAKAGVPAVNFSHGSDFIDKSNKDAAKFLFEYTEKYYHQVGDEYHDWWDMSAMVQEAEFALSFGIKIANAPTMPRYNEQDEFARPDALRFKTAKRK
ncbi:MAG: M28 family peptidase [Acidobacteria bacterium]|nr:M28 family peptidase [Acidobacteriota bacterium]